MAILSSKSHSPWDSSHVAGTLVECEDPGTGRKAPVPSLLGTLSEAQDSLGVRRTDHIQQVLVETQG